MDVVKSLKQNLIHGDTDPTSRINFSSLPPLKTTPTPLLKTTYVQLNREKLGDSGHHEEHNNGLL